MQIKSHGYGIKGWYGVKRYALRMQTVNETAQRRVKILNFWQRAYRAGPCQAHVLNNKSLRPCAAVTSVLGSGHPGRLLQLRAQMPAIGLEKLHVFLLDWCEPGDQHCPSLSTLRRRARQDVRLAAVHKHPPASSRIKAQG